jgi:putative endonuclease
MPSPKHKKRAYRYGLVSEYLVIIFLTLKGYRILSRRYKVPQGEIDIIAKSFNTLIFIEVKARKNHSYLYDALSYFQQQRIMNAADHFIARYPYYQNYTQRFDLILINKYHPIHVKNAWGDIM